MPEQVQSTRAIEKEKQDLDVGGKELSMYMSIQHVHENCVCMQKRR